MFRAGAQFGARRCLMISCRGVLSTGDVRAQPCEGEGMHRAPSSRWMHLSRVAATRVIRLVTMGATAFCHNGTGRSYELDPTGIARLPAVQGNAPGFLNEAARLRCGALGCSLSGQRY